MAHFSSKARVVATLLALVFLEVFASGFTFVASPPAKLPVTLESPTITFMWDGKAPGFEEKDTFREGFFANMSDEQIMAALISEAMGSWNKVRGSYIKLQRSDATDGLVRDKEDRVNVIVVTETNNLNSAAFANPNISKASDRSEISDCDITVGTKRVTIKFMIYALTHELGHCLGLGHAHDNYHSIMGYSRSPGSTELGADDKAGVIYLYGDPAYGDPQVRELIGIHCGVVGGRGVPTPPRSVAWVLFGLPLLMLSLRRGVTAT